MTIEYDVLSEIKPTPAECSEILGKADRLKATAEKYVEDNGIDAVVKLVGSVGKGTFLRNPDLDLFICFSEEVPRDKMEELGIKIGKEIVGGVLMYAEHPYTSGSFEGLDVDVVPCYAIRTTADLKTSVDRSPFHAAYILGHSDEKMRDEIRIMKKFMKGIGTYGAEPDVRGFSGYLCELLVVRYGSFIGVLEAAKKWKTGMSIDLGVVSASLSGAMVFYDPVDGKRNVASAVHEDTLCKFITAAKTYLACPDRRFFFPEERKPMTRDELSARWVSRKTGLIALKFERPDIIPENLHAQIWKTQNGVGKKLSDYGFGVLRAEHYDTEKEVCIVFELTMFELPPLRVHLGPKAFAPNSKFFIEKWCDNEFGAPFIEDGVWKVVCNVPFRTAADMIRKEISQSGVGKALSVNTVRILSQNEVIEECEERTLTEVFDPRFPWEN